MADPENGANPGSPPAADWSATADAVLKRLDSLQETLKTRLDQLKAPPPEPPQSKLERFFSSGFFFIVLGICLLFSAYLGLAIGVHSSFSFVLVVLGTAILLFGTGTQGVGNLESTASVVKYNVAIAGGAGVLALAIGFGMIRFGSDMQRAFGLETQYVVALLRPNPDGSSDFSGYWAEFEVDGVPIPSAHRGDVILALVPYFSTQASKRVSYRIRSQETTTRNPILRPAILASFEVPLTNLNRNNSGFDFPVYDGVPPVDMRSESNAAAALQAAASQSLPSAPDRSSPKPTQPAVVIAQ